MPQPHWNSYHCSDILCSFTCMVPPSWNAFSPSWSPFLPSPSHSHCLTFSTGTPIYPSALDQMSSAPWSLRQHFAQPSITKLTTLFCKHYFQSFLLDSENLKERHLLITESSFVLETKQVLHTHVLHKQTKKPHSPDKTYTKKLNKKGSRGTTSDQVSSMTPSPVSCM